LILKRFRDEARERGLFRGAAAMLP
jgi:hypothetical protein